MKTKIILFALLVFSLTNAQTEKGTKLIGGDFSIGFNKNKSTNTIDNLNTTNKSYGVNLSPKFGYFIKNNLAIGTSIYFANSKNENEDFNNENNSFIKVKTISTSVGANFFVNYYKPIIGKLSIILNNNIGFYNSKSTYINSQNTDENSIKSNNFSINVNPGLIYFINNKFSLSYKLLNIQYYHGKSTNSNNENSTIFNNTSNSFNANLSTNVFNLGLDYYFK
ncbi:outer membrane beta-barrel protein [uncultured Flavobacterium sp.]|uniref:outer membrane beta-barrel protein n=1 Tax=uncultured Flavobacterium sp. TaxID=165435 RepID=UPI0030CA4884